MTSPLEQFLIKVLIPLHVFGLDISITNATCFMMIITGCILFFQWWGLKGTVIPTRVQSLYEMTYEFIAKILKENAGREGMRYFPFIFSLFMFILTANILGMFPYSFTVTSHIAVTFTLALGLFLTIVFIGFKKHGLKFLTIFYPKGVPLAVSPLVVPIEILAFLIRPITLSVRLFANMLAGHIVLKLFAMFTVAMGVWGFMPFAFVIALTAFEFLIAVLQAYVFTVLTCIYLHDALHLH